MKKLIFSVAMICVANFSFGQINLEHSFDAEQYVLTYVDSNTLKYVALKNNQITIYNSDYSISNTFQVTIPAGFNRVFLSTFNDFPFNVSKHVFNTDNNLEFFVFFQGNNYPESKVMIYNENGNIIKDFAGNYVYELVQIFHDNITNTNKLKLGKYETGSSNPRFDIYSLPTSSLTTKEIQQGGKLSAFPIPTNKILNIINPQNGTNKIEIFDVTGKMVIVKNFTNTDNKISLDVENLPKGTYLYKIGDLSSKFIKN